MFALNLQLSAYFSLRVCMKVKKVGSLQPFREEFALLNIYLYGNGALIKKMLLRDVLSGYDTYMLYHQACKITFRLRELISCFYCVQTSHAACKADGQGSSGT